MKKLGFAIVVFLITIGGSFWALNPDTTLRLLTADVYVPEQIQPSLLKDNLEGQKTRHEAREISFSEFRAMRFSQNDVIQLSKTSKGLAPELEYFGLGPDGIIYFSTVSVADVFTKRSPIYKNDWRMFRFDRLTGHAEVPSEFNGELLAGWLLVFALITAFTAAFNLPLRKNDFRWLLFLCSAVANTIVFYVWQKDRGGYTVEASIFVFATGLIAVWLFELLWNVILGSVNQEEETTPLGRFFYSMFFLAIGVLLETGISGFIFGSENWTDLVPLGCLFLTPNFLVNYMFFREHQ